MSARWLILDFVDAPLRLTGDQKREIKRIARRLAAQGRSCGGGVPAVGASPPRSPWWFVPFERSPATFEIVAILVGLTIGWNVIQRPRDAVVWIAVAVSLALWIILSKALFRMWQPWYRLAMFKMGLPITPICIACGYDLAGIETQQSGSQRCPECGWLIPRRDAIQQIDWRQEDQEGLLEAGHAVCEQCGELVPLSGKTCPRCGHLR